MVFRACICTMLPPPAHMRARIRHHPTKVLFRNVLPLKFFFNVLYFFLQYTRKLYGIEILISYLAWKFWYQEETLIGRSFCHLYIVIEYGKYTRKNLNSLDFLNFN